MELGKACFENDMVYGDFKGLTRRTASDKILCNKAFNIGKNPNYDEYQRGLASVVYKCFDKKTAGGVAMPANKFAVKNENISNKELAQGLHRFINTRLQYQKTCILIN